MKTLPFLSYGDATKNLINQIAYILQWSTAQPCLKILPLPPMLLKSQTPYPSPVFVTHTYAPDIRVEQVVQPPRLKTPMTAGVSLLRVKHAPSPSLDTFINPWIKKVYKKKKNPYTIPTKQKQVSSHQVQHFLCRSPQNNGTNFCTQEAQHLMAGHLFKLPHAFRIYNDQGKKETIDKLLVGGNSDTWWKAVGN